MIPKPNSPNSIINMELEMCNLKFTISVPYTLQAVRYIYSLYAVPCSLYAKKGCFCKHPFLKNKANFPRLWAKNDDSAEKQSQFKANQTQYLPAEDGIEGGQTQFLSAAGGFVILCLMWL